MAGSNLWRFIIRSIKKLCKQVQRLLIVNVELICFSRSSWAAFNGQPKFVLNYDLLRQIRPVG